MAAPKPVSITQRAAIAGEPAPEPLVVIGNIAGAVVAPATTTTFGTVKKAATQADFVGADITALKVELNAWKAKLVAAGIEA